MKLRRWLAVTISVILIMYSFPVYATSEGEIKETESEMEVAKMAIEEEAEEIPDLEKMEETEVSVDEYESTVENHIQESKERYESETEVSAESETVTEESVENESKTKETSETTEQEIENTDASDIASGTYENITWTIDKDGKLTVTGTGEFAELGGKWERAPWYDYKDTILTAEISIKGITSLRCMFLDCENLVSIDLVGLETQNVTNMCSIFSGCSSLSNLDVSGFDTRNVTDMSQMFLGCSKLTDLDVCGFNTENVTDMENMFWLCSSLAILDVSGFDTRNVKYMSYMFGDCSSLTNLDVSSFDTGNVTSMWQMFGGCSGLTSLDVSGFNTGNVTNMESMFSDCSSLTSLDVSGFDTGNVTDMRGMFSGCSGLTGLDVSGFDTGNVIYMESMFSGCSSLTGLDVSGFDTRNAKYMSCMFRVCSSLTDLDVSGFNTENVKEISGVFEGCGSLKDLDLSSFDLGNINNIENISLLLFAGCNNLVKIITPKNVTCDVLLPTSTGYSWYYNDTEITSLPKNLTSSVIITKSEKPASSDDIASGTYDGITWVIDKAGKLTVTGTGEFSGGIGYTRAPWYSYNSSILSAEVMVENIRDVSYMFYGCSNLKSADVSGLNTQNVTNMESMFYDCSSLTSVVVSGFNTGNVTNMENMFYNCSSLTSVDVSGFHTGNVTSMEGMFWDCGSLISVDVGNFNTENVTNLRGMFYGCSKLRSVDVSNFETENVTDISYLFCHCSSLTGVDVSSFHTENVTSMECMFNRCSSLTNIDVSSFQTGNVTNMAHMFCDCSELTSVDVSKFNTGNVTDMMSMFSGCSSLKSVDVSNFQTGNVTNMGWMFSNCSGLTGIDVSSFQTGNVTSMEGMFRDSTSLTNIDLSSFDTRNVTSMESMFYNCSNLTNVNLRSFDTVNVKSMRYMFFICGNLTSVDLRSFDIRNVTNAENMLSGCRNLVKINTPKNALLSIALPEGEGAWYHDEAEITELPLNQGISVEITRRKAEESSEPEESSEVETSSAPDKPATPEITTTKIENAVQNVPYEAILQNNGWDKATYQLSEGALPEGIDLGTDGVIYGITKSSGKFRFTVTMTVNGEEASAQRTLTLEVLKSTDRVVNAIDEPGYEIIQPIQDINTDKEVTDQLFISNGPFPEFRNAYIDGNKLIREVDYTAESGSTRITIKSETLDRLEKGKHTLGVEFRTEGGTLKRVAQNFDVNNGKSNKKGGSGDSASSGASSGSANKPKTTITPSGVTETMLDDTIYYSVYLPSDDAILKLSFFNKVYGDNVAILAYLDNGVGYSLNMNAFLSAGKDLNLSTKEIKLEGFAQGFQTIWLSIAQKEDLNYDLGINLSAGAEYANHPVYIFIYDDVTKSFVLYLETIVAPTGNIGFHTKRLTDFVVMIAK